MMISSMTSQTIERGPKCLALTGQRLGLKYLGPTGPIHGPDYLRPTATQSGS